MKMTNKKNLIKIGLFQDFPGGPMAKTTHSQQKRPEFSPWSGH